MVLLLPRQPDKQTLPTRWNNLREANSIGLSGERLRLWDSDARNILVPAGRQSLKTEIVAKRKIILSLLNTSAYGPWRAFYAAPTQQQATRIVWEDWKRLVPPIWVHPKLGGKINESEHYIRTWWGSEAWCVGLDKPQRLEGDGWDLGVLDESADLKPGVWKEHIQPMIRSRNGRSYHIGVPDYRGAGAQDYKELCEYAQLSGDPQWDYFWWPTWEVMAPELIEQARKETTELLFRQEYGAEWITAPGRAYYCFNKTDHVRSSTIDKELDLHIFCDFNRTYHNWGIGQVMQHPSALMPGKWYYRAVKQVFYENATVEVMCENLTKIISDIDPKYLENKKRLKFYGDFTGQSQNATATYSAWKQIEMSFQGAEFYYQTQPGVADRIDKVNTNLLNAAGITSIEVDPSYKELIDDMEYVKSSDLIGQKNKIGRRTHASDAFGYWICQHEREVSRQQLIKRLR